MAADMAVELKKQNVACVSLWPGAVMTEHVNDFLSQPQDEIVIFFIFIFLTPPPPRKEAFYLVWGTIRSQVCLVVLKQKLQCYFEAFTNFFLDLFIDRNCQRRKLRCIENSRLHVLGTDTHQVKLPPCLCKGNFYKFL